MSEKEIERKEESSKEPALTAKRSYVSPQLQEYGNLTDLTQGDSGPLPEAGGGTFTL